MSRCTRVAHPGPPPPRSLLPLAIKLPVAAMVRFPHLGDEPVKIALTSGRWCVNPSKRSKQQQMWVSRKQLPIIPSFAVTAHSSQGKTLPKAIVDLRIPRGREPIAAYVALSP
eukprot:gene57851-biopygen10109